MFDCTRIFHAPQAFVGKAFKGEAAVCYCEPLTRRRSASYGAPYRPLGY